LPGGLEINVGIKDLRTIGSERIGDRLPDAPRSAGDQGNLAIQFDLHYSPHVPKLRLTGILFFAKSRWFLCAGGIDLPTECNSAYSHGASHTGLHAARFERRDAEKPPCRRRIKKQRQNTEKQEKPGLKAGIIVR
jgi:hypothetical protein